MNRAAALLVVPLLCVAGCSDDPDGPDDEPASARTEVIEVEGARVAFEVEVPVGLAISDVVEDGDCGVVTYRFAGSRASGPESMVVEAVPTDCALATANDEPGNGRHGVYRTVGDVPEPLDPSTLDTGLGTADVVEQEYYECTNECRRWDEPVAIVTLDEPVDPGYPTLVVRGERDAITRDELEQVVESLTRP